VSVPCPHPTKTRYATRATAESAANRVSFQAGVTLRPYECPCTWWHLTKSAAEILPDPADASTADVQRLAALPDIDFREIVATDARGEGNPVDRAALRNQHNLTRWKKYLGQLHQDLDQQLRDRRGDKSLAAHDWRKRVAGYREAIALRASECRRLKAEAHADMTRNQTFRKHDIEIAMAAGASLQELRQQAGDIAIRRLIEAHSPEFNGYLAEIYADLGITLPERIRRRLPAQAAAPTQTEEQAS
jgi:hypothetical protein